MALERGGCKYADRQSIGLDLEMIFVHLDNLTFKTKNRGSSMIKTAAIAFLAYLLPATVFAFGVSHHGGIILDCTPPIFFEESPAKETKVIALQKLSFAASENTDRDTIKVWVNNEPIAVTISEQRSGRLAIEGVLSQPVTEGRAWIKVAGYSNDGCDQLHVWNVYTGGHP